MVWNAESEGVVHRVRYAFVNLQSLSRSETLEARYARRPVPGVQANGVEVIDAVGDSEAMDQRLEPDAARHDEDRPLIPQRLNRTTQPTQEFVHALRVAVVVEHALEEDGQLVDREEHRGFVVGAVPEQLFAELSPVAGVKSGPNPRTEAVETDLLDVLAQPLLEAAAEAGGDRTGGVRLLRDGRDRVLRAGRALDIREQEDPAVGFQPPSELSGNAGLAHPPLSGQQEVVVVPEVRFQNPELGLAVEEVVVAHPAAGGWSHGSPSVRVASGSEREYTPVLLSTTLLCSLEPATDTLAGFPAFRDPGDRAKWGAERPCHYIGPSRCQPRPRPHDPNLPRRRAQRPGPAPQEGDQSGSTLVREASGTPSPQAAYLQSQGNHRQR